jgi:RNA polymerase sigma factor (sigma-70 family)
VDAEKARSDSELDVLWRAGSRDSGSELVRRHFDRLYRFFSATVPGQADDLVQETFLAFLHRPEPAKGPTDVRSFLMGIARNKVLMHWRTHARRRDRPVDFELDTVDELAETQTQVRARTEEQRVLLRSLRGIPLEMQILLQLYYWEGMKARELARFFDTTELAIRHRLRRAKELLARRIAEVSLDPDARRTTVDDLDRWVERVRAEADARRPAGDE